MAKKVLSPKELLRDARKVPKKAPYLTAAEVAPVVDMLRGKGLMAKEIQAWFKERGHEWNTTSLMNAWRHWERKKKAKK